MAAGSKGCLEWAYDETVFESTAVTEYNLVCSRYSRCRYGIFANIKALARGTTARRNHLKSVVGIALVLIVGLGSVFFGFMSDRLGRRPTILASILAGSLFNVMASYADSFLSYCALFVTAGKLRVAKSDSNGC